MLAHKVLQPFSLMNRASNTCVHAGIDHDARALPCVFGCAARDGGIDDLSHYLGCPVLWAAAEQDSGVPASSPVIGRLAVGAPGDGARLRGAALAYSGTTMPSRFRGQRRCLRTLGGGESRRARGPTLCAHLTKRFTKSCHDRTCDSGEGRCVAPFLTCVDNTHALSPLHGNTYMRTLR